jgi:serine/threonine protein kinase
VAEGARLESVFTRKGNEGSNPSLSAMVLRAPRQPDSTEASARNREIKRRPTTIVIPRFSARLQWRAPMALLSGTQLRPYEILSPLGAGGMGEVYRAHDRWLEREVAVKVPRAGLSSERSLRQRLEREAKAVSKPSHPHICTLHDIGDQNGVALLVMEWVEGRPWSFGWPEDLCRRSRPPVWPRQLRMRAIRLISRESRTVTATGLRRARNSTAEKVLSDRKRAFYRRATALHPQNHGQHRVFRQLASLKIGPQHARNDAGATLTFICEASA